MPSDLDSTQQGYRGLHAKKKKGSYSRGITAVHSHMHKQHKRYQRDMDEKQGSETLYALDEPHYIEYVYCNKG